MSEDDAGRRQAFLDLLVGKQPAEPLSFEKQPPAAEQIPAALSALAESGDLMDLGVDAQAQGAMMVLQACASRLVAVLRDLEHVGYADADVSEALRAVVERLSERSGELRTVLEERGADRRGDDGDAGEG